MKGSNIDSNFVSYWKVLEIPIEDFIDELEADEKAFVKKVFNRLKSRSGGWLQFFGLDKVRERDKFKKFRQIFDKNKELVLSAYCCSWFAGKINHLGLIREYAFRYLEKSEVSAYKDDVELLIFLLYLKHKEVLVDLSYDFLIRKSKFNRYVPESPPLDVGKVQLDKEMAQALLDKYESRRKRRRQKSKIWWFKETEKEWIIVFRRSRLKSVPIKLVDRNEFIRLADLKIFKIRKDFSLVEIYTKKEEKTLVKFVENFAKDLANINLKLVKEERRYPQEKINKLISEWISGQEKDVRLLEVAFRNFPLMDSPTVIIKAQDEELGIENALKELKECDWTLDMNDCEYVRLKFQGKRFTIKFVRNGENVSIVLDHRGLSLDDKEKILNYIDKKVR